MSYTILMIDDNQDELDKLIAHISKLFDNVVLLTANTLTKCSEILATRPVDVLLMDVELSHGGNGVNFVSKLRRKKAFQTLPVIFVSGKFIDFEYRFNALKNTTYIDYLLKPIESKELKKALSNAFKYVDKSQYEEFIISTGERKSTIMIDSETFLYAKKRRKATKIDLYMLNLKNGEIMTSCIRKTIKQFLKDIKGSIFFKRCGNSHIINKKMISGYDGEWGELMLRKNLGKVPLGGRFEDEFKEFIGK